MTFSVTHPTCRLDGPTRWEEAFEDWVSKASVKKNLEYVVAVHESRFDDVANWYMFNGVRVKPVRSTGRDCVVDNGNAAAAAATGDVVIGSTDDFFAPRTWDVALEQFLLEQVGSLWRTGEYLINLLPGRFTHGAMSRALYTRWGYLMCPQYYSMFVDDDNFERAIHENVAIVEAGHLGFEHRHHSLGKRRPDRYDDEHTSTQAYAWGRGVLEGRRSEWRRCATDNPCEGCKEKSR